MTRRRVVLTLAFALASAVVAVGAAAAATSGGDAPSSNEAPVAAAVEVAVSAEPAAVAATAVEDDHAPDDADDADDADGPDDVDVPITGPDLERASAVALEYLGEGRVTETEVGDEESYYEVEVTLPDGRHIDVQLDEAFNVVGTD